MVEKNFDPDPDQDQAGEDLDLLFENMTDFVADEETAVRH